VAARLDDREALSQLSVFSITYLIYLIILLFVFVMCIMIIDLTNFDFENGQNILYIFFKQNATCTVTLRAIFTHIWAREEVQLQVSIELEILRSELDEMLPLLAAM